tara:strand:- start:1339 stop:4686 length:3348 start_codon:yes stop_codon:yes gene_type:complete
MAEFIQDTFRGLIVPDDRLTVANLSAADSNYNQANPTAGDPVQQQDSALVLEASGNQTPTSQLRIATQRGGHPQGGATFRWKDETDPATQWRGWDPPSAASAWRALEWSTGAAPINDPTDNPHALTLQDGRVLVAYERIKVIAFVTNYQVVVMPLNLDGTTGASVVVWSTTDTLTQPLAPCLVELPNGRVVLFHYLQDLQAQVVQIQALDSDDYGATWAIMNSKALNVSVDVSAITTAWDLSAKPASKLRVAYSGGQLLLLIAARSRDGVSGSYQDGFIQYASADLGNNFQLVEEWPRTQTGTAQEIIPVANGFDVLFIKSTGGNPSATRRQLSSAYSLLTTAEDVSGPNQLGASFVSLGTFSGRTFQDADLAATVDDSGILYCVARGRNTAGSYASSFNGLIRMVQDPSGGASIAPWDLMGQGTFQDGSGSPPIPNAGTIWNHELIDTFPRWLTLARLGGRLVLIHNWLAVTGTNDQSLGAIYLGGYSDHTLPSYQNNGSTARRLTWDWTWFPIEKPDVLAWALTVSAGGSTSLVNGDLEIVTTAALAQHTKTPVGTVDQGITLAAAVEYVSSGSPFADDIAIQVTQEDGGQGFKSKVSIEGGHVKVRDAYNALAIIGTLAINTANGVEIMIFQRLNKITVKARPRDYIASRLWTTVVEGGTLTDNGGGGTSEIRWGHDPASTATSKWRWFHYTAAQYACGVPAATGFTNPTDLDGRPIGSSVPTYVDAGVSIRGIDGPTFPAEVFNIDPRFGFPVSNMLQEHEPSPRRGWRSTDETQQRIAWRWDGPTLANELGLYLDGMNWKTGSLEGYNETTATWDVLGTINTSTNQSALPFTRVGDMVTVNTAAAHVGERYFEHSELIGATAALSGTKRRAIISNTAGVWGNAAGQQRPMIRFSGEDGTEPATGDLDIWNPRIVIAIHNVNAVYSGFRLVIDATQGTVDGFYKVGQMALGPLHLFTQDYSWGRGITTQPNVELIEYRDGSRSSFKRGPTRRAVNFGWVDGVDVSKLQGFQPQPDYVLATSTVGADPIGYRGDVPSLLQALVGDNGANRPVVYVPRIEKGTPNALTMIAKASSIYGRIVSDVAVDAMLGEELDQVRGEVLRVATITVEEEL